MGSKGSYTLATIKMGLVELTKQRGVKLPERLLRSSQTHEICHVPEVSA
jgi:hypothetical protein